jgi:hypothetical protein
MNFGTENAERWSYIGFLFLRIVDETTQHAVWYHVSRASFTAGDWRLTVLEMSEDAAGLLRVRGSRWVSSWIAFEDVLDPGDSNHGRTLQVFVMRCRRRLLTTRFQVSVVKVNPFTEPTRIWPTAAPLPRGPRAPHDANNRRDRNDPRRCRRVADGGEDAMVCRSSPAPPHSTVPVPITSSIKPRKPAPALPVAEKHEQHAFCSAAAPVQHEWHQQRQYQQH